MSVQRAPLLAMRGISKRFPGVVALDDVSLDLERGRVLALMGENGAGKSTLMKVLSGALQPDSGEIRIDGQPVSFPSVRAAQHLGVALVHQELMLAPNLDLAANLFLGNEPGGRGSLRGLRRRELSERARTLLERIGLALPPSTRTSTLSMGQLQLLVIAKALALSARIIILDEPTSSLTAGESQHLFEIVRRLAAEGVGVIYISHRLEEVLQLADRISVLRDGRRVGDVERENATRDEVVRLMVGRQMSGQYYPPRAARSRPSGGPEAPLLEVRDLLVPGARHPVSFQLLRGEILGFAGLIGAGRTELMATLFGVTPARSGAMTLNGRAYAPRTPSDAIEAGMFLAPEDRKRQGLVLGMSVAENTSLPGLHRFSRAGWLNRSWERSVARQQVAQLRIRASGVQQRVGNLSGGNQQKVVLGKWLALKPLVLILDEPTRGIDVGAKAEIYRQIVELAAQGVSLLLVSSDLEEVLEMSDRVVVMHERMIRSVVPSAEASAQHIATLMTRADAASVEAAAGAGGPP
jgi:ribose transport system ATP-binding protein